MRTIICAALLGLTFLSYAQDDDYRVIPSLTDWIEEINNWPDSVYKVENIKVIIDEEKDSLIAENYMISARRDSLEKIAVTINKPLQITGLIIDNDFGRGNYGLKNIRFKERMFLFEYQSLVFHMSNLIFEKGISFIRQKRYTYFNFWNCEFRERVGLFDFEESSNFAFSDCKIDPYLQVTRTPGNPDMYVEKCEIPKVYLEQLDELHITDSKIEDLNLQGSNIQTTAHILTSNIGSINISGATLPDLNTYIPFNQISKKVYVDPVYRSDSNRDKFFASDTVNFELTEEYDMLIASYKILLNGYQNRGDRNSYGACFVEMKDIETQRLAYLYQKAPTFKGFFTWKINQFLRLFSAYGTEPARAVIVSMYVILGFALIYLFFPNHWDSHGKNRMKDRYLFFMKYLSVDKGIRDVYLEEKKEQIAEGETFRQVLENYRGEVPSLFYKTARPLYSWSVASTRIAAGMLNYFDFLKGTWKDTDPAVRTGKTVLVTMIFFFALLYDLFIKVLNAVMLSINTFTTLGFGEIPIKGLPRYLAIIQGFIGWFMLTIFSVSLISQLLN